MDRVALIDSTLPKAVKADAILRAMRREKRDATAEEQALIDEVEACREIIIQVHPRLDPWCSRHANGDLRHGTTAPSRLFWPAGPFISLDPSPTRAWSSRARTLNRWLWFPWGGRPNGR